MQSAALLVFLAVVCLASAKEYKPRSGVHPGVAFEEFIHFFNKTYASPEEKQNRFATFVRAGRRIAELNANAPAGGARFGYTKFADWEPEEFKKLNGFVKSQNPLPKPAGTGKRAVHQSQAIDWVAQGKTTPVKNQEQCGSCWAFSATETVESANLIAGHSVPNGSPQEIVDCDSNDNGCSGGDPQEALQWVVNQGGLDTDNCYPYTAQDGDCASSNCNPNPNLKISTVTPVAQDENSIYQALQSGPLSICCDASQWQYYTGGVLAGSQCGDNIDHAIQLTGYSPDQGGYWIVRNSWGSDWGENGFIYLQYGANTCGITSEVTGASV